MWKQTKKKIIKNVINTQFIRKKINYITMDIFSFIIKMHINSIICLIITTNINVLDFTLQLLVSILLYYYGNIFNEIVYIYDKKFYKITNYFIDNYSTKNLDIWKKKTVLSINLYLIVLLYFINVTSNILIVYSIQYTFYLLILDYINNKKWKNLMKRFNNWYNKPRTIKYSNDNIDIKEDYLFLKDDNNINKELIVYNNKKTIIKSNDYEYID